MLLTTRELIGVAVQVELDIEGGHQLVHALFHIAFGFASEFQRVGDVVDGAHPREHGFAVVLKHITDIGVFERFAIEQDLSAVDGN